MRTPGDPAVVIRIEPVERDGIEVLESTMPTQADLGPPRIPGLDGLRGVAVVAVMAYHFGASLGSGGYLGVDMFFVLSGFLVTRNLLHLSRHPGWLRCFAVRRVTRLYPVLTLFLAVMAAWWAATEGLDAAMATSLLGGLLMSFNGALRLGARSRDVIHLWSLAVEWQYYLSAPILALAGRKWLRVGHRAVVLAGIAAAVVGVRVVALLATSIDAFTIYVWMPFRLEGLLLGMVIAFTPPGRLRPLAGRGIVALATVGLGALVMLGPAWHIEPVPALAVLIPLASVCTAVVVIGEVVASWTATATGPTGRGRPDIVVSPPGRGGWRPGHLLDAPILIWLGRRSYSIYLWHYFVGVTVIGHQSEAWQGLPVFAAQMVLSLAAGEVSYRLVERPARAVLNNRLLPAGPGRVSPGCRPAS